MSTPPSPRYSERRRGGKFCAIWNVVGAPEDLWLRVPVLGAIPMPTPRRPGRTTSRPHPGPPPTPDRLYTCTPASYFRPGFGLLHILRLLVRGCGLLALMWSVVEWWRRRACEGGGVDFEALVLLPGSWCIPKSSGSGSGSGCSFLGRKNQRTLVATSGRSSCWSSGGGVEVFSSRAGCCWLVLEGTLVGIGWVPACVSRCGRMFFGIPEKRGISSLGGYGALRT